MTELVDIQLIQRCVQQNDVHAFESLVERHQSRLRYSLRQLTGWDEALADDIAQEAFLKAYRSIHSFKATAKFSTWLYRIAYNEFIDYCRKNRLDIDSNFPDLDGAAAFDSVATNSESNKDLHRDLARAMLLLSAEQRVALHLTLHRECTQLEVAEIMECPLGTVKSHILRGRERLQQILADWREEILL